MAFSGLVSGILDSEHRGAIIAYSDHKTNSV
jgi:hypothetical protein